VLLTLLLLGFAEAACSLAGAVQGTVGQEVAAEARQSAGAVYGAVETLNREVLPRLPGDEDGWQLYVGDTLFLNLARLPMEHSDPNCGRGEVAEYAYDINTVNIAGAVRTGPLTLMYSTSAQMSYAPSGVFWRAGMPAVNALGGTYWAFAAPLVGANDDLYDGIGNAGEFGVNYDFVAGATLDVVGNDIGAGYVGSRGFYLTGLSRVTRLFGRATASDRLQRLPQLIGGLGRLPVPGEMLTSAYARRVEIGPPDLLSVDDEGAEPVPVFQRPSLTSAHLAQENIAGLVDIKGGVRILPTPGLYEVKVRLHPKIDDLEDLVADRLTPDLISSVHVGVIQSPAVERFGLPSKPLLQAGIQRPFELKSGWMVTASLTLNDDEVMAVFPYARNAFMLRLQTTPGAAL